MKKHLFIIIILTIFIIFCISSDYNNLIEAFDDIIFENVPNNVLLERYYRNDPSDYQGSPKLDLNLYEKEQPYNLSLQELGSCIVNILFILYRSLIFFFKNVFKI